MSSDSQRRNQDKAHKFKLMMALECSLNSMLSGIYYLFIYLFNLYE